MHFQYTPQTRRLIEAALDEDDIAFDVSSAAFPDGHTSRARLVAKEDLVVAGLPVAERVFRTVDRRIDWSFEVEDGSRLQPGDVLAEGSGPTAALLRGERTALNFLQRLSGIATKAAAYVDALADPTTRIVDTRKTLPGWRELDKYAVRCGGAHNHRYSLGGGAMIKDNHIAAAGSIQAAIERVHKFAPHTIKVEVECDTLEQVDAALEAGTEVILLDNMTTDTMRRAIGAIREAAGDDVLVEASGNITLQRLPELGGLGLDLISSGALTHSVRAADISMRMEARE